MNSDIALKSVEFGEISTKSRLADRSVRSPETATDRSPTHLALDDVLQLELTGRPPNSED